MRRIVPGLTSTRKEGIPAFLTEMERLRVREIALFPTCLSREERWSLYESLERIGGVSCPHVHLRSDCDADEIAFLGKAFGARAFNVHPASSTHPFGKIPEGMERQFWVENVDHLPDAAEAGAMGGLCPDFSHWENAEMLGIPGYDAAMRALLSRFPVGCCHLSAIRPGERNSWGSGHDFHSFKELSELDYLAKYAAFLPPGPCSLELENPLAEQLEAARYLSRLLNI